MGPIPAHLLDGLSPADAVAVAAWWAGLAEAARAVVADLCDPRREAGFFGPARGAPKVIGGRFIPRDDAAGWSEWHAALFEQLVRQPDPSLIAPPVVRVFRICARHQAARAVLRGGTVPPDFRCPLGSEEYPMRRLFGPTPNQALQPTGAAVEPSRDIMSLARGHGG